MSDDFDPNDIPLEELPNYTVKEWEQWEGDWELINGLPYAMSPAPSKRHQRVAGNILVKLTESLTKCDQCEVYLPTNFKIDNRNILIPDLVIVCNENEEGIYLETIPKVVFEILSPSTKLKDLNTKKRKYAEAGVKYYVIIDPDSDTVQVFQLNGKREYGEVFNHPAESFTFDLDDCKLSLDFSAAWN